MNLTIKTRPRRVVSAITINDQSWFTFGETKQIHIRIDEHLFRLTETGLVCITTIESIEKHSYTGVQYVEIEELIIF